MPLVQVGGRSIWVATVGASPAPTLMIHCALARHETLLPLAKAMHCGATLFDVPGHGRSSDWDNIGDYQAQTAGIAAALCDGPTHIVGHSFGATVALRFAVENPQLVRRLTLIEPVFFAAAAGRPEHDAHIAAFQPFVAAMEAGDRLQAARLFQGMWGQGDWDAMTPLRQNYILDRMHLVLAGASAIEDDPDGIVSPARLAKLDVPVSLIRGQGSPAVMSAIHAALCDRLPRASDHVIADAKHMVAITHVDEVAGIIAANCAVA